MSVIVLETLNLRAEGSALFAEIAAPPMNLLGPELVRDLVSLIRWAEADDAVQVLVFSSADPDYFISHVDLTRIAEYRAEAAKLVGVPSIALLFRHLSAEFALACDMRSPHVKQRSFPRSRTASMRSRSHRPTTSAATRISSASSCAPRRRSSGSRPRCSGECRPATRNLIWRPCSASWEKAERPEFDAARGRVPAMKGREQ